MKGAIKSKNIQVRVTPRQHDRWCEAAKDFDISVAEFARACCDSFIYFKDRQEGQGKTVSLMGRVSYRPAK